MHVSTLPYYFQMHVKIILTFIAASLSSPIKNKLFKDNHKIITKVHPRHNKIRLTLQANYFIPHSSIIYKVSQPIMH